MNTTLKEDIKIDFKQEFLRLKKDKNAILLAHYYQVDEIQDETFGSLAVYASGEADSVRGAVAHLRAGGVEVEEVAVAG